MGRDNTDEACERWPGEPSGRCNYTNRYQKLIISLNAWLEALLISAACKCWQWLWLSSLGGGAVICIAEKHKRADAPVLPGSGRLLLGCKQRFSRFWFHVHMCIVHHLFCHLVKFILGAFSVPWKQPFFQGCVRWMENLGAEWSGNRRVPGQRKIPVCGYLKCLWEYTFLVVSHFRST